MSDHSSKFVSYFFHSLGTALDMRLHFTSGYHPEANGQAEQTNQMLEQYLYIYCNYQQDNWSELLPLAEFAYNNTPSATTSVFPFFANKEYHSNLSVYPEWCKGTSRIMLSKFWGSVLLMAQWQIMYRTPIVSDFFCLCYAVWCLLLVILGHSVIIGQLPWCCVPDYLV